MEKFKVLKKIGAFWRENKKAIVAVISLTPAAIYLPVIVPVADIAADAAVQAEPAGESQPGQSQGEGK
jgi:hypothetical protein